VIEIYMTIQHDRTCDRFDRARDSINRPGLAAFAEVWYTLNQAICDFRFSIFDWTWSFKAGSLVRQSKSKIANLKSEMQ